MPAMACGLRLRHLLTALMGMGAAALGWATQALPAEALPPEVRQALRRSGVPDHALSVVIQPAGGGPTRLQHQATLPVNPASLTKLVTTYMALDRLGPAWAWPTPVHLGGPVRDGVLDGDLVIEGRGDPTLVIERLWQGLLALRQGGIERIRGDIVLDRRAFAPAEASPADFDGDPTRPYNVLPDALLLNYHAALWTFEPDPANGRARVIRDVDLPAPGPGTPPTGDDRVRAASAANAPVPPTAPAVASVPLTAGPCGDWRSSLRIEPAGADWRPRGAYPAACKAQTWPLAAADPQAFGERLMGDLWRAVGGRLDGRVRSVSAKDTTGIRPGADPTPADPRLVWRSPPLAQVVRDINKFSNNVMAQQLFLTLGVMAMQAPPDANDSNGTNNTSGTSSAHGDETPEATPGRERGRQAGAAAVPPWPGTATPQAARAAMQRWVTARLGPPAPGEFVIDNGSGLSRQTRMSAQWLARMLQHAWSSPVMPEFLASLPVAGVDGTMRRSRATPGRAHLKTGSLRDVIGRAGYVLDDQGRRHVFVALIQHPNAQAARPALDALVEWAMRAAPAPAPTAAAGPLAQAKDQGKAQAQTPTRVAGSSSSPGIQRSTNGGSTQDAKRVSSARSSPRIQDTKDNKNVKNPPSATGTKNNPGAKTP
jgi:D-alanyl-D-alanine carboxypeptidase/D-alanyl-D-alanine-endopeptidase (penicillin-binding protein 4)